MAAAAQQDKSTTVSAEYDVPTEGTIFVLTEDVKKSLSGKLSRENDGSSLSDYTHDVLVEDYSAGHARVKVSAKAVTKK